MAELLAPAGDMERLEYAVAYGADAVYFGAKDFSLRSFAGNFTIEEADTALKLLHSKGKKGYVTLNIYPYSEEYPALLRTAKDLEAINADAFIVSDLGVIYELKKAGIKTPLHISTQANTMSHQTILSYAELGAKRVNLARELSIQRIRDIQTNVAGKVETEVFVHGAVCFSYSGRCAISDYMTGRKANRGECTHPCRWKYSVVEETRPNEYYPVAEDDRGLYLFNNKDLALFPYINELSKIGVTSFKIEGRMKTIHYISTIVSLYRRIMDGENISEQEAYDTLFKVSNRGYTLGFIKGGITPNDYAWDDNKPKATTIFVANVVEDNGTSCVLRIRNKIKSGETLELLSPDGTTSKITISTPIQLKDGNICDVANNEDIIILDQSIPKYGILRRVL